MQHLDLRPRPIRGLSALAGSIIIVMAAVGGAAAHPTANGSQNSDSDRDLDAPMTNLARADALDRAGAEIAVEVEPAEVDEVEPPEVAEVEPPEVAEVEPPEVAEVEPPEVDDDGDVDEANEAEDGDADEAEDDDADEAQDDDADEAQDDDESEDDD